MKKRNLLYFFIVLLISTYVCLGADEDFPRILSLQNETITQQSE